MYETFRITPDWKPIETAPKDRPIWVATKSLDHVTGEERRSHQAVYWWKDPQFPNSDHYWYIVGGDCAFIEDDDFIKKVTKYHDHGVDKEIVRYHGCKITHWAEIHNHSVIVAHPDGSCWPDKIETKIYNM